VQARALQRPRLCRGPVMSSGCPASFLPHALRGPSHGHLRRTSDIVPMKHDLLYPNLVAWSEMRVTPEEDGSKNQEPNCLAGTIPPRVASNKFV